MTIEEIYQKHWRDVYRFLYSYCRDPFLAEDLTQDVFLKVFRNIGTFDNRCKLSTWIYQIAKNTYFDYARKTQNRKKIADLQAVSNESIQDDVQSNENMADLLESIAQLNPTKAEILRLRSIAGLSYAEIAAIFGKTESWARVNFYRAKQELLERMHNNET